ncbi:hypothetical protein CFP56_023231 [Quercus suber]|uniref:Uncharacterized protein n=1 Tax=Quercus suber TaxID=58331 RepID=A0AAW0KAZ8_QUESU
MGYLMRLDRCRFGVAVELAACEAEASDGIVVVLKEAGNRLLNPHSSIDDLLTLLDEVENLLGYMEQVPSKSMRDALFPSVKALINNKLLRHAKMDVKVAAVSCIIEITRITNIRMSK